MNKTYLTLEDAQEMIPFLRRDVLRLMKLNKALSLLNSVEIEYEDDYQTLSHEITFNKRFHKLSLEFYSLLEKLHLKGCYVKDLNRGIIDFFSFFETREIFLCWNVSDDEIKYWHEADLGYKSRKPVSMIRKRIKN